MPVREGRHQCIAPCMIMERRWSSQTKQCRVRPIYQSLHGSLCLLFVCVRRWVNQLFGHICHAPLMVPFNGWRISHRHHHQVCLLATAACQWEASCLRNVRRSKSYSRNMNVTILREKQTCVWYLVPFNDCTFFDSVAAGCKHHSPKSISRACGRATGSKICGHRPRSTRPTWRPSPLTMMRVELPELRKLVLKN